MIYDIHLHVFIIVYVIIVGLILLICMLKKNSKTLFVWRSIFTLYILLLIKVTIFPFTFEHIPLVNEKSYLAIQLKPFQSIKKLIGQGNYIQIFGNIILMMPLPVLYEGIKAKEISRIQKLFMVSIASISVEFIQIVINIFTKVRNHVFDVDDIILNILGGIILIALYRPVNCLTRSVVLYISGESRFKEN